jgi:DNA-binding MarR family transcriptional regulator
MEQNRVSLLAELKQTRPYASPAEEAVVAVLRTASLLRRALNRRVESQGISAAQYNVLRILRGAGEDGLPTLAVRDRLVEEAPGITRLIDKLEKAGLVTRLNDKKDRRTVRCRITAAGLRVLEELEPAMQEVQHLVHAGIPDAESLRQFLGRLASVRAQLNAERSPARGGGRTTARSGR